MALYIVRLFYLRSFCDAHNIREEGAMVLRKYVKVQRMDFSGSSAGILEQSMGARNRVGIGLSYRPARPHRLADSIPWNRFPGSFKVKKYRLCRGNMERFCDSITQNKGITENKLSRLVLSAGGKGGDWRQVRLGRSSGVTAPLPPEVDNR